MQFLITGYDGSDPEAQNRRQVARPAHITLGNEMRDRGELLYAVALLSDEGIMIGSVCVVDFPSHDELEGWLKVEPYVSGKVWEEVEIQPCRVGPSFSKTKAV